MWQQGRTVLMEACRNNQLELATLLLTPYQIKRRSSVLGTYSIIGPSPNLNILDKVVVNRIMEFYHLSD